MKNSRSHRASGRSSRVTPIEILESRIAPATVLNYTGTGAGAITLDLTTSTITEFGLGSVVYSGIDQLNIDANNTLTVTGTAGNDTFDVIPLTADMGGRFTHSLTAGLVFTYDDATTVTFTGGTGGDDLVNLLGDEAADAVTATASTVTADGSTVTIGAGIEELDVQGLGGNDTIDLTLFSATARVEIYAGDGSDTVRGSTVSDIIHGGAGNDILMGGAGDDFVYGEDGNDTFGNPTLTSDGVADDAGTDQNFGGDGFDNFVWEPGDGADFNNGGEDGADIFRFFGNVAVNAFTLRSGGTPTHFNALIGALVIDNHGIEDVIVDGQGGADTFTVDDLFATEVVSLNLVLGSADGAVDTVTVSGRAVSDNILVSTPAAGAVRIAGLRYNVNLTTVEAADALVVNGGDGNDTINVSVGVAAIVGVTLSGGLGDDVLSGDAATMNGNEGNDTLIGSAINNTFDGGAGDDTFLGNGGTDAAGGGAGSSVGDTILLPGTAGIDTLSLALNATGHLLATVNGLTTTYTNFLGGPIATSGVERIKAEGQDGTDALTVDSANGSIPVPITFDGGASSDSLTLTGGTATADTYSPGPHPGAGTSTIVIGGITQVVTFTGLEPVNDLVAGPLTVNANDAANSITYTVGRDDANTADDATRGKVSIDAQEFINFSNKTTLTINALGGGDTISLNNPNTPTGLTGITVNGGDPTGSDLVIVNGTTGADAVTFDALSANSANFTGAGPVPISVTTTEHLIYNGLGGADALTVNGTSADDVLTFDTATGGGSGSFRSNAGPDFDFAAVAGVTLNGGADGLDVAILGGGAGTDTVTVAAGALTLARGSYSGTLTIGTDVDAIEINTLGGDDNVNLTGFTGAPATIRGADGNDTIRGSDLGDIIFGGAGNDILMGGLGNDFVYGEDGNDIFGNPALTADGLADDAGTDQNFGGDGFDNFVWEPGDGPDFNQGGDEGADIFRFFGSAAANAFILRPGGTPTHFNALIGALVIDNHGIEDVIVDGQGGADTFTVDDLFATEVVSLNLNLGAADAALDAVTVNGRTSDDNLVVTSPGAGSVRIAGLRYNVNLTNAEATDELTLNGNDGNDSINVSLGVAAIVGVTANGGVGNDVLSGDAARINAGDGNDTLIGSAIDQTMDGGAGDDTFLGNGGTDAIGGGAGAAVGDTILLPGTAGDDTLALALNASGHLVATINTLSTTYTNFIGGPIATSGIERIKADGQDGTDALTVDSTNGSIPVPITFDGGASSDSLTLTGGTATADTYSPGPHPGAGTSTIVIGGITQVVTFTGLEPVNDLVAGPLTVNANDAANSITYSVGRDDANTADDVTRGKVSIDAHEFINFSNKTTLTINALGGGDSISLNNPNTPTGLTGILVNGGDPTGSDELIIVGTDGADTFTFAGVSLSAGAVTLTGAAPIAFTGIEDAIADGQAGADLFNLSSAVGRLKIRGGEGSDTVDFSTDASNVVFSLDAIGVEQNVNVTGKVIAVLDRIENLTGTPFNDVLFATIQNFTRSINGGPPSALPGLPNASVPPGDILNFDALGQFSQVTKLDKNTGTISAPSFPALDYDEIETLKVVNSSSAPGFSGLEPGAFTAAVRYKVGKLPDKVVTGDLNGDGFDDIVTVSAAWKTVSVLLARGDGTFEPSVKFNVGGFGGLAPKTLTLGNVDDDASIAGGDDDLDIIVANRNRGRVAVLLNDGTGNFGAPTTFKTTSAPHSLQVGDFNEDGLLDIATLNAGSRLGILLNTGAGVAGTASFGPVTKFKTGGVKSSDFVVGNFDADASGHLDFAVVHSTSNKLRILTGDGTGLFVREATKYEAGINPTVLAIADFNSDGIPDIAVNHNSRHYIGILFGRGSAGGDLFENPLKTRSTVALGSSFVMVAGDFNNDGNADLAIANDNGAKLRIALGEPDGTLLMKANYRLTYIPDPSTMHRLSSIAVGDFNGDGATDIVVSHRTDGMATVVLRRTSL